MAQDSATVAPYTRRVIDEELDQLLPELPAIALEGAKGVGKTMTAARRASTTRALDERGVRQLAEADPSWLLSGTPPVLIDEWQRLPETWDLVRRAVDEHFAPGRFLLTGSATPVDPGTHSGAGRIVRLRMRPMTLAERGVETPTVSLAELLEGRRPRLGGSTEVRLADYAAEICASGFPELRRLSSRPLRAQLDGYLNGIIDRDFAELGTVVRKPALLRRWMTAYAAATSTVATFEVIRDAATPGEGDKPPRTTTAPYRDILERLWIIDPVPAWLPTRNHLRRLGARPKHQLADPALAARLLKASPDALLDGRAADPPFARDETLLGQLFESLVTLDLRVYAQNTEAHVGHLRTHSGTHEVDLIVERDDHRVVAVEVKLTRAVDDRDVKHLQWLQDQLGDELLDAVIVTTGSDAYRRRDGIAVVPAALLGP